MGWYGFFRCSLEGAGRGAALLEDMRRGRRTVWHGSGCRDPGGPRGTCGSPRGIRHSCHGAAAAGPAASRQLPRRTEGREKWEYSKMRSSVLYKPELPWIWLDVL